MGDWIPNIIFRALMIAHLITAIEIIVIVFNVNGGVIAIINTGHIIGIFPHPRRTVLNTVPKIVRIIVIFELISCCIAICNTKMGNFVHVVVAGTVLFAYPICIIVETVVRIADTVSVFQNLVSWAFCAVIFGWPCTFLTCAMAN